LRIAIRLALQLLLGGALPASTLFAQTDTISSVAGGGLPDNIPATSASTGYAYGIAVDHLGNLFVASRDYGVIFRRDSASGLLTVAAGNGTFGYSGDGGSAMCAQLGLLNGLAIDSVGNLYISDAFSNTVRKISNGVITTVAGRGGTGRAATTGRPPALNWLSPRASR
jgi:hypothetical protein